MDITSMDTEMKNMVRASDKDAQYDEKAKRLLGHKYILAYIKEGVYTPPCEHGG